MHQFGKLKNGIALIAASAVLSSCALAYPKPDGIEISVSLEGDAPFCLEWSNWVVNERPLRMPADLLAIQDHRCTGAKPAPDGKYKAWGTGFTVRYPNGIRTLEVEYVRADKSVHKVRFDLEGKLQPMLGKKLSSLTAVVSEKGVSLVRRDYAKDLNRPGSHIGVSTVVEYQAER